MSSYKIDLLQLLRNQAFNHSVTTAMIAISVRLSCRTISFFKQGPFPAVINIMFVFSSAFQNCFWSIVCNYSCFKISSFVTDSFSVSPENLCGTIKFLFCTFSASSLQHHFPSLSSFLTRSKTRYPVGLSLVCGHAHTFCLHFCVCIVAYIFFLRYYG